MTNRLTAKLVAVAEATKKCLGIEIELGVYSGCSCPAPPADCPICKGTGQVFVLPNSMRMECLTCKGGGSWWRASTHYGILDEWHICPDCQGRGWDPSRDLAAWIPAIRHGGFDIQYSCLGWSVFPIGHRGDDTFPIVEVKDDNDLEALISALANALVAQANL